MRDRSTILLLSPSGGEIPELIAKWVEQCDAPLICVSGVEELMSKALRSLPELIIMDPEGGAEEVTVEGCRSLKKDPHTVVVPVVFVSSHHETNSVQGWFSAGADEVVTPLFAPDEQRSRLNSLVARTKRNIAVHPTTMLPGTPEIEREVRERIEAKRDFAICYADLDHFKEYNDRYNYQNGDKIIYILSRILRDVTTGLALSGGFVGHIGGDDFIMILPLDSVNAVCGEIISVFDTLIPLQYSAQDREAGYFLGKDRRGQLHKVPTMTLSIGIVTSENKRFEHPARVSALATEMKAYAKSLPGSVYVVDRRRDIRQT